MYEITFMNNYGQIDTFEGEFSDESEITSYNECLNNKNFVIVKDSNFEIFSIKSY